MRQEIPVTGWQSWSYCGNHSRFLPNRYFSPFERNNAAHIQNKEKGGYKPPIKGWCSWHWFGQNINEELILNQAKYIAGNHENFPVDYVLIDDGWCRVGDWLKPDKNKFPHGMKWLADEIKSLGLKPGIWIAPFFGEFTSRLAAAHPDWLLRNKRGKIIEGTKIGLFDKFLPVKRGILDITQKQVRNYLKEVMENITGWGYELIKLDFLYANHYNPNFDSSDEPDGLLHDFLINIKKKYSDVYTIACGCPLKPALSAVDAIRISDDINFPTLKGLRPLNSLIASLRLKQLESNLIHRLALSGVVNLDPDAFICHRSHGLSHFQISKLLHTVRKSNGLKFLGDNLPQLSRHEIETYIKPLFS